MNEIIKKYLKNLYTEEIKKIECVIYNESIFEENLANYFKFRGEHNYHTENIKLLKEYIKVLEEKINELGIYEEKE